MIRKAVIVVLTLLSGLAGVAWVWAQVPGPSLEELQTFGNNSFVNKRALAVARVNGVYVRCFDVSVGSSRLSFQLKGRLGGEPPRAEVFQVTPGTLAVTMGPERLAKNHNLRPKRNWHFRVPAFAATSWSKMRNNVRADTSYRLTIHALVAMVLLAAYPTIAFIRGPLRRWRRRKRGECVNCGYNLTGNVTGVCSECGTKIEVG